MLHNPYKIVRMFEEELASYTKAPFVVTTDSCTNALFLCCSYLKVTDISIPRHTYLSVPMSVIHAGGRVTFDSRQWSGIYQLEPYPIYDAAKRFTSDMYIPGTLMCLSFHIKKILGIGKGGAILTDNYEAVEWLREMRYEGRHEVSYKMDDITSLGWNMYMSPLFAARGLELMQNMPMNNKDIGEGGGEGYRDLTEFTVFKNFPKV